MAISHRTGSDAGIAGLLGGPSAMFSADQRARQAQEQRRRDRARQVETQLSRNLTSQTHSRRIAMGTAGYNFGVGDRAYGGRRRGRGRHAERIAAAEDYRQFGSTGERPSWQRERGWSEGREMSWQRERGWSEGREMPWQRFQEGYGRRGRGSVRTRLSGRREENTEPEAAPRREGGTQRGIMQGARIRARQRRMQQRREEEQRSRARVVARSENQREAR